MSLFLGSWSVKCGGCLQRIVWVIIYCLPLSNFPNWFCLPVALLTTSLIVWQLVFVATTKLLLPIGIIAKTTRIRPKSFPFDKYLWKRTYSTDLSGDFWASAFVLVTEDATPHCFSHFLPPLLNTLDQPALNCITPWCQPSQTALWPLSLCLCHHHKKRGICYHRLPVVTGMASIT